MIINVWLEFLVSMAQFEPFYYIAGSLVAVCAVLLIRCLKVW